MITAHRTQKRTAAGGSKAKRRMALAFLFCLCVRHTPAQTNTVTGTAYGTDYAALATAASIASLSNANGSLTIRSPNTAALSLNHAIQGTVTLNNKFSTFAITGNGSVVSNGTEASVLLVMGGTNLTITGAAFAGDRGSSTINLPPIPGQGNGYLYSTNASMGGLLNNVKTATIARSRFTGSAYAPSADLVLGTEGLSVSGSTLLFADDGTQSSVVTGGDSGNIYSPTNSVATYGGQGLYALNSSVTVSNGTFRGGSAGNAESGGNLATSSVGGNALQIENGSLTILNGTFTGGNAGTSKASRAGAGVYALNSTVFIGGGTFTGGTYGSERTFSLLSRADAGKTAYITLNGGTFGWIGLEGGGTQYITADTNAPTITQGIAQNGGLVIATNVADTAFQSVTVKSGIFRFINDFTLEAGGYLHLSSPQAFAEAPGRNVAFASGSTNFVTVGFSGAGIVRADSLLFQTNATMAITSELGGLAAGATFTSTVAQATSAINIVTAGNVTNAATAASFEENVNLVGGNIGRTVLLGALIDGGTDLKLHFTTQTLSGYWGVIGELARLADELDTLASSNMLAAIDGFGSPAASAAAVNEAYFATFNPFQTSLFSLRTAVGQSLSRSTEFRDQLKLPAPSGARGPEAENNLRGWGKYYGNFLTHDAVGTTPEYESILHGGVVGVDTSIGRLLVGLSGGAGAASTTFESDAEETITAFHGNLYGTYGWERAYLDAGAAMGFNQVETRSAKELDLRGEYDAQLANLYFGGGYDLVDTKGGTVFTPEASFQYAYYQQDDYEEESDISVPRHIKGFDATSLLSSIGLNVSMLNSTSFETFGFKLEGRAHWMHEFNPDVDGTTFRLEGGNNMYPLTYPALDEELYRVGLGCSFFNTLRQKPKNVLFRIDFDELFSGSFNSHNLAAKVIYAF